MKLLNGWTKNLFGVKSSVMCVLWYTAHSPNIELTPENTQQLMVMHRKWLRQHEH